MLTDAPEHNLALMKLSAYHKNNGDQVEMITGNEFKIYDKIYGSYIFTWNRQKALDLKKFMSKGL